MHTVARLGFSLAPLLAALLVSGCKTVEKNEDEVDASVPPPAASSAVVPSATVTATAPPPPVAPTLAPPPKADAGPPSDAGTVPSADAGPVVADAGAGAAAAAAFKACSDKCQAVLQGCAIPAMPKDGGLPQIKDPVACQAAASACFAACKP